MTFDHILVVGFGGPTRPEEVKPFIEEVARGLRIPAERLAVVARQYDAIGGRSPYHEHTVRLVERLTAQLGDRRIRLPVFMGMKSWHPFLRETIGEISRRGLSRGLGVILAPHRSEASYERYVRGVEEAAAQAGAPGLCYAYLKPWHDHPLFIEAQAEQARAALDRIEPREREAVHLLFSAHSIPVEMARRCRYEEAFRASSRLVADALRAASWSCAYQSRSGDPRQPWLEPDVLMALRGLKTQGARGVCLVPIGFLSDHAEILYDLDIQAREEAERLGLHLWRAPTVMDHPQFVAMLVQLIEVQVRGHETQFLPRHRISIAQHTFMW